MGRFAKSHFLDVQLANGYSTSTTTTTTTTWQPHSHIYSASTSYITPLKLAPREETTRISLQRQRYQEQHAKTLVSASTIPGLKTSAAFFASLRTNLRLHASPPSSPLSTPNSMRGSTTTLPPPSPLSGPALTVDMDVPDTLLPQEHPLAGVPELSSYIATDEFEKMEAMKLVADSVAQQRQAANRALISHPLNMAVVIGALALLSRFMLDRGWDVLATGMTCMGLLMTAMAACRYLTQGYLRAAEGINFEWLGDADILVTKFGDEVIGTVMVEWISGESRTKKKKAWRGLVRAWTVRLKYRHKGVGGALLEDAVSAAKKKGAESLEFAEEHANSQRVLPKLYNGAMNRNEVKSIEQLQDLMETSPKKGGKRRLTN
ncbi:putative GNAT domain, acyl-CoA N-acyltransferase [Septoria linicola]|nr:putative GNAT domain, acyl-CoA N-acyltransferase [Septoria linicola]